MKTAAPIFLHIYIRIIPISLIGDWQPLPIFNSARNSHAFSFIHDFVNLSAPN